MDSNLYINTIKQQIVELEAEAVKEKIESGHACTIIDVREAGEVEMGVIPNAVLSPRGFLECKINTIAKNSDDEIILYCAGGVRSALSAKSLNDMGYTKVYSLAGGMARWQSLNYPLEKKNS